MENTQQKDTRTSQPLLMWSAPSVTIHNRSKRWYVCATLFGLFCVVYSIFTQAWTFTVLIAGIGALYYFVHKAEVPHRSISIGEHGVQLDEIFTSWDECKDYWMLQGKDYVELHITKKKGHNREIVIQTGSVNPQEIRTVLAPFLPEETEHRERVLDIVTRLLKI